MSVQPISLYRNKRTSSTLLLRWSVYQQKHNKWTSVVRCVKSLKTKTKYQIFSRLPFISFDIRCFACVLYWLTLSMCLSSFLWLRTIASSFFDKSEGRAFEFDVHMGSFKISTGPRPSLLYNCIPSPIRLWQSAPRPDIIPREDPPPLVAPAWTPYISPSQKASFSLLSSTNSDV